jgi:hypothetical protein
MSRIAQDFDRAMNMIMKPFPSEEQRREEFWDRLCEAIKDFDLNGRAVMVQSAIAEFGPVPNSRGDKIRQLLSNETKP